MTEQGLTLCTAYLQEAIDALLPVMDRPSTATLLDTLPNPIPVRVQHTNKPTQRPPVSKMLIHFGHLVGSPLEILRYVKHREFLLHRFGIAKSAGADDFRKLGILDRRPLITNVLAVMSKEARWTYYYPVLGFNYAVSEYNQIAIQGQTIQVTRQTEHTLYQALLRFYRSEHPAFLRETEKIGRTINNHLKRINFQPTAANKNCLIYSCAKLDFNGQENIDNSIQGYKEEEPDDSRLHLQIAPTLFHRQPIKELDAFAFDQPQERDQALTALIESWQLSQPLFTPQDITTQYNRVVEHIAYLEQELRARKVRGLKPLQPVIVDDLHYNAPPVAIIKPVGNKFLVYTVAVEDEEAGALGLFVGAVETFTEKQLYAWLDKCTDQCCFLHEHFYRLQPVEAEIAKQMVQMRRELANITSRLKQGENWRIVAQEEKADTLTSETIADYLNSLIPNHPARPGLNALADAQAEAECPDN
jgi:hypothetical protein